MQESLSPAAQEISHLLICSFETFTAWGVEPVVTHQKSWLESTGVYGNRQSAIQGLYKAQHDSEFESQLMPISTAACVNISGLRGPAVLIHQQWCRVWSAWRDCHLHEVV